MMRLRARSVFMQGSNTPGHGVKTMRVPRWRLSLWLFGSFFTVQMLCGGEMMLSMNDALKAQGSTLIPSVRYRDAHAAIDWLVRVFGFHKQAVYDGPDGTVMHAQLTHGLGMLMLGSVAGHGEFSKVMVQPDEIDGRETTGLCLVVEDCEAVYANAKAAGAEMVQELTSPEYGGRAFACRDLEGHVWWIGSYDPWADHSQEQA